jgi:hypothetical protein
VPRTRKPIIYFIFSNDLSGSHRIDGAFGRASEPGVRNPESDVLDSGVAIIIMFVIVSKCPNATTIEHIAD